MTSRRFVVGQTMYAIRGVTSVAIAREFIPGTSTGTFSLGCGGLLLIAGGVTLIVAAAEGNGLAWMLAVAFVVPGAFTLRKSIVDHKAPRLDNDGRRR